MREIVLDTETTGFLVADGHRLVSVTAIELVDRKPTGKEFSVIVNPGRDIPAATTKIHGITDEMVKDKPAFPAVAKELQDFIGASPIIITCYTMKDHDGGDYVLDIDMLNMEMEKAGLAPFPARQWVNVRRWAEAMFGSDQAHLDNILDRYKIDRSQRDREGHSATLDAQLLAAAYPKLLADYNKFKKQHKPKPPSP